MSGKMKKRRKNWLSLILVCALSLAGSAQVLAETVSEEQAGQSTVFESVDVSGMVYQAGGFGTPARKNGDIAPYAISVSDRVKEEILQALQAKEKSLDVSAYEMTFDDLYVLFSEVLNENGKLFYVSSRLNCTSASGKAIVLGFNYEEVTEEQSQAFAGKLAEAASLITPSMSDMEKALALHDYVAQHCAYAYQELKDGTLNNCPNVYDAYGALVRGKAVCQGYAEGYQALLQEAGIVSYVCSSDSMNHAWNVVLIDGNWYHVDVTWDDPVWNREGCACHEYFLLSDEEMTNRKHSGWVDNVECNSVEYDDCWWKDVESRIVQIASGDYIYVKNNGGKFQIVRRTGGTENVLYKNDLYWPVWGGSGYWTTAFSFLSGQGCHIYFNDRNTVYSMDPNTMATPEAVYNYDKNDGYIYGAMVYEDEKIRLNIRQSPNEETDSYIEIIPALDATHCVSGALKWLGNGENAAVIRLMNDVQEIAAEQSVTENMAEYKFINVPSGTYTLRISGRNHVTREYPINVTDTNVSQDAELQLLGDVNGDGTINARDQKLLYNHLEKIALLSGYRFQVGDVNGDGTINARDKKLLYNHIERIALLW